MMPLEPFTPVWPETTIFWGAGATVSLGFPATAKQGEFIHALCDKKDWPDKIKEYHDKWDNNVCENMRNLLIVLGADADVKIAKITQPQREALVKQYPEMVNKDEDDISDIIVNLRTRYDFDALRRISKVIPYNDNDPYRFLVDLFNILDMHLSARLSFNVESHGGPPLETLSQVRLQGARDCLLMLFGMMIQGAYMGMIENKRDDYQRYIDFSHALARLMQEEGMRLSRDQNDCYNKRAWYLFSYAVVSMNFDPLFMWLIFNAHKEANDNHPPHIGNPCRPLKLFTDFGHIAAMRRIQASSGLEPWYPYNEAAIQRINDPEHACGRIVRLGKLYFLHGCYCWRECPSCGKLIMHLGDEWSFYSKTLLPPMPLQKEFLSEARSEAEQVERKNGRQEVLQCSHCGALTYSYHTQPIMQSLVKGIHPSFLEEIARDTRACIENTRHIVLFGYTLPPDDMVIRTLLMSRIGDKDKDKDKKKKYCTVVVGYRGEKRWMSGESALKDYCDAHKRDDDPAAWGVPAIQAAMDIFGGDNVRAFTGGIPQVFETSGDMYSCVREILYPADIGMDCFSRDGVIRATGKQ